jgi:PAS domain S-box-containing protein
MNSNTSNNNSVLVISDRPEQFSLTASLLQEEGYTVLFERDSRQSLNIVKAESPRMIISELAVPNVDGLELCARLSQAKDLSPTRVILVGDLSKRSSIVADGLRCGAADYLQKPVDQRELFDVCRSVVEPRGLQHEPDGDRGLLMSLFENISDVITIINANDQRIVFQSPSAKRAFGYEAEELVGQCMTDLVHQSDLKEVTEYLSSIHWSVRDREPVEYRIRQKSGSWKLVESVAHPINDARFGSAVIVTTLDRGPAEPSMEAILADNAVYEAIFENGAVPMALLTSSAHVIKTNTALLQMLDHSAEDLHGMALSEIIFPSGAGDDRLKLVEVLSGRRRYHEFQNGYLLPNGARIWSRLTVVPVPSNRSADRYLMLIFENPFQDQPRVDRAVSAGPVIVDGRIVPGILDLTGWSVDQSLISNN